MSSHSNNEDETNSAGDEVTRAQGSCISEQIYIQSGNDKKVLHLLSIGLTDNNNNSKEEPLFSLDQEPWLKLPKSSIIRPRNNDYVHEIARRANLFHIIPAPRPKNWTRAQTLEWLERNAISNEADVAFLRNEVRRLRRVFERQMQEQQESLVVGSGGSGSNNGSWRGSVPYLRVIMCLTQDNVKALFLTRANSQSRQQLDARNSNNRPPTVFEVIAELWNDSSFNPLAPASECHADFQMATDCSYELVAGLLPATPQKIEDCFSTMRSKLIRIIDNWELSGQGEGGRDREEEEEDDNEDDESSTTSSISLPSVGDNDSSSCRLRRTRRKEFGSLRNRPPRALQSRAAFLRGEPSYVLYFWEIADTHQLLRSSVQRLNEDTGAGDASMAATVTTTTSGRSARRRNAHDEAQQRVAYEAAVLTSLEELAKGHSQMRSEREQDRVHDRQLEEQRMESERQQSCRQRVFQRRTELLDIGRKYRKLNAELDMGNERSQRLSEFYLNECQLVEEELRQLLEER